MVIQFALIAEGGGDKPLVDILANLCRRVAGVAASGLWANDALALHEVGKNLPAQIQAVVKYHGNLDLLFIHRDSDSSDDTSTRQHIDAAIQAAASALRAVAVVPIQETEAWLLTDEDAIRLAAGNPHGRRRLLENLNLDGNVTQLRAWQRLLEDIERVLGPKSHTA